MTSATAPASSPSIYPILSVNFVGTLGFSIVLPFLVFLVTRLGGNALIYGIMGATYSAFQLIGAPILGRWSDRYGRRKILLLSQLGTLASWGIFLIALMLPAEPIVEVDSRLLGAFTLTIPLGILFVARALDGLTGGNVSVANAYLADITSEEDRGASFGKMAVSSNLGFVLGPVLAGLLGATVLGEILPVMAAFAVSAVASLIIALKLPETQRCAIRGDLGGAGVRKVMGQEQKECFKLEGAGTLSLTQLLRLPAIARLLSLYFLVFLSFNLFYIAFPVHAATGLGWSLRQVAVFFSVTGLLMALVQGPILKRASKIWSDRWLVIGGSLTLAAAFALFTSEKVTIIYSGTALMALGNGLMWPSLLAILSRAADGSVQGAVQGFAGSAGAIASVLGFLIGGLLYGLMSANIFVLSALIAAFVFGLSFSIESPEPASSP